MSDIIIFGNAELAELAHFYFSKDSPYTVKGFCVDPEYVKESSFRGLPVIDSEELEKKYTPDSIKLFIAIGYKGVNQLRKEKFEHYNSQGYEMPSYVSTKAHSWLSDPTVQNTMIMEGSVVMPYCKIGNNVLVWVNSILSHHSVIEDHVCITSHCAVGGNVHIQERAFLGLNCTIRQNLNIGKASVIGTAANVVTNTEDESLYLGNPAVKSEKSVFEIDL